MYFHYLILNLLALGALFANHRLASMICFLAYTAVNIAFLFHARPTDLDPIFFTIMTLSTLAVYVSLSANSRDQVLTHQKKRASLHLLVWGLVIAFFFGHWFMALKKGSTKIGDLKVSAAGLENGEVFMLLAIVVLWMVGKNLYDRR